MYSVDAKFGRPYLEVVQSEFKYTLALLTSMYVHKTCACNLCSLLQHGLLHYKHVSCVPPVTSRSNYLACLFSAVSAIRLHLTECKNASISKQRSHEYLRPISTSFPACNTINVPVTHFRYSRKINCWSDILGPLLSVSHAAWQHYLSQFRTLQSPPTHLTIQNRGAFCIKKTLNRVEIIPH